MQKQFNAQFKKLFKNSIYGLQKALELKITSINKVGDSDLIQMEHEYRNVQNTNAKK